MQSKSPLRSNEAIASFDNTTLRVQVCNLNLEVYVFLGVVTVQLGIACSNYRVQEVAKLKFLDIKLCVGWIKALVFTPNPPIMFPGKVDSLSLNPPYRKPA